MMMTDGGAEYEAIEPCTGAVESDAPHRRTRPTGSDPRSYQRQQKLHDRTVCPQCGALYHEGRWRWMARAEAAFEALCAACRRINDKFPAGVVTLQGDFAREHKEEIIRLVRHQEEAEKQEHPLNRIISIEEDAHGVAINTTDIHLPRRIGEAVKRAFHGKIEDHFEKDGYFVRVNWSREA